MGDFGSEVSSTMFQVLMIGFLATICWSIVSALVRGIRNAASPAMSERAMVVAKRSRATENSGRYWVTFEMLGGHRVELPMGGRAFGQLAEGDHGTLDYQGTRYKGFHRDLVSRVP